MPLLASQAPACLEQVSCCLSCAEGCSLLHAGPRGLRVVIPHSTGCISRWEAGGQSMLAEPLQPCFFRACIDNDRGGTDGRSYASRRAQSSIACLHWTLRSCALNKTRTQAAYMLLNTLLAELACGGFHAAGRPSFVGVRGKCR